VASAGFWLVRVVLLPGSGGICLRSPCTSTPVDPLSGREKDHLQVILLAAPKSEALPAVYWSAGCCLGHFGCELDGSCFLGCGSEVACAMGEASGDGAVPVVVV
jgi:hypothetical protein